MGSRPKSAGCTQSKDDEKKKKKRQNAARPGELGDFRP